MSQHVGGAEVMSAHMGGAEVMSQDVGGAEVMSEHVGGAEVMSQDVGGAEVMSEHVGGAEVMWLFYRHGQELPELAQRVADHPAHLHPLCSARGRLPLHPHPAVAHHQRQGAARSVLWTRFPQHFTAWPVAALTTPTHSFLFIK